MRLCVCEYILIWCKSSFQHNADSVYLFNNTKRVLNGIRVSHFRMHARMEVKDFFEKRQLLNLDRRSQHILTNTSQTNEASRMGLMVNEQRF